MANPSELTGLDPHRKNICSRNDELIDEMYGPGGWKWMGGVGPQGSGAGLSDPIGPGMGSVEVSDPRLASPGAVPPSLLNPEGLGTPASPISLNQNAGAAPKAQYKGQLAPDADTRFLESLPKPGEPPRGSSRVLGDMLVNRTDYAPGYWGPQGMLSSETLTRIDPLSIATQLRGSGFGPLAKFMPKAYEISKGYYDTDRQRILQESQAERFRGQTATETAQESRLSDQLKFEKTLKMVAAVDQMQGTPQEKAKIKNDLLQQVGLVNPAASKPVATKTLGQSLNEWSPGHQMWKAFHGGHSTADVLRQQWGIGGDDSRFMQWMPNLVGDVGDRAGDLLAIFGAGKLGIPGAARFANMGKAIPGAAPGASAAAPGLMSKLIGLFRRGQGAAPSPVPVAPNPLAGMMGS